MLPLEFVGGKQTLENEGITVTFSGVYKINDEKIVARSIEKAKLDGEDDYEKLGEEFKLTVDTRKIHVEKGETKILEFNIER